MGVQNSERKRKTQKEYTRKIKDSVAFLSSRYSSMYPRVSRETIDLKDKETRLENAP